MSDEPRASAITAAFDECRRQRRAAFIPYLTAGDPDLETTGELLDALVAAGADVIELGVPFSDPIADGPVNQRAAHRALESGTTLSGILRLVARKRQTVGVPIVLFTYFNPIHARGVQNFAEQAATSGVDGVLCVDLPPDEAEEELIPALRAHGIDSIFLLAPTSTRERVRKVARASSGFVYYVSRTGVTGVQDRLPPELAGEVRRVRRRLKQPLAVGFGISTPEQVAAVGRLADGVVVGSALVRVVEENAGRAGLPALIEARARELAAPLRERRPRFFGRR
ncbi:MAG TPA: tryptophan synthase subunit alpha [Thermoanaerobaculia bacterium]|nr:tryptophan synthase subunit alpha [Thermoanaerobaculia bacterium]